MRLLEEFITVFKVPKVAEPHVQIMVDEQEMQLTVWLKGRAMTLSEVADLVKVTHEEASIFFKKVLCPWIG